MRLFMCLPHGGFPCDQHSIAPGEGHEVLSTFSEPRTVLGSKGSKDIASMALAERAGNAQSDLSVSRLVVKDCRTPREGREQRGKRGAAGQESRNIWGGIPGQGNSRRVYTGPDRSPGGCGARVGPRELWTPSSSADLSLSVPSTCLP